MDDFASALAGLRQQLVDLDGDGVPDAVAAAPRLTARGGILNEFSTSQPPNAMARSGLAPTGEAREYQPSRGEDAAASLREMGPIGNAMAPVAQAGLDYGGIPAEIVSSIAMQPVRAGQSVGNAMADPTLANVTDAGVQTALTFGKPLHAGAALAGGLLEGARRDLGASVIDPADARQKKRNAPAAPSYEPVELPGLTPEQNAAYNDARSRIMRGAFRSGSERRTLEGEVNRLSDLSARIQESDANAERQLETERKQAERQEYDRAVSRAEEARDKELDRSRRFSETEIGKVYEKTGGVAPLMAAFGAGAMGRLAHGGNAMGRYVLPAAEGAITGAAVSGAPLLYDAQMTDPDNPEKSAYRAYARELPPEHPRKQEFADYAAGLPDENPVRATAREEFKSPERWIMSGLEGAGLGFTGSTAASMAARAGNAMAAPFRRASETPVREVTRVKDKRGRTLYHGEDGKFTSAPKRQR